MRLRGAWPLGQTDRVVARSAREFNETVLEKVMSGTWEIEH